MASLLGVVHLVAMVSVLATPSLLQWSHQTQRLALSLILMFWAPLTKLKLYKKAHLIPIIITTRLNTIKAKERVMSENTQERRSRRGGGRDACRQVRGGGGLAPSAPYITRNIAPVDILSDEVPEIIENMQKPFWKRLGSTSVMMQKHWIFSKMLVVTLRASGFISRAASQESCNSPKPFPQHARNPERSVEIGGNKTVFALFMARHSCVT